MSFWHKGLFNKYLLRSPWIIVHLLLNRHKSFPSILRRSLPWEVVFFSFCISRRSLLYVLPLFMEWIIMRRMGKNCVFLNSILHGYVRVLFFSYKTCIAGQIYRWHQHRISLFFSFTSLTTLIVSLPLKLRKPVPFFIAHSINSIFYGLFRIISHCRRCHRCFFNIYACPIFFFHPSIDMRLICIIWEYSETSNERDASWTLIQEFFLSRCCI